MRSIAAYWMILTIVPATITLADEAVERAARNGQHAADAGARSNRVMHAWLLRSDPLTGLLPHRGPKRGVDLNALTERPPDPNWIVANSAADLYPFMVIAAYFTEPATYHGPMRRILRQEVRWSSRLGRLADDVKAGGGFLRENVDLYRIIFGSSEYAKDGLLPLTELLGDTAWYHRMRGITDDILAHAPHTTPHGPLPCDSAEVNGNMLQILSRMWWKTRDPAYLQAIQSLADFYFGQVLPASGNLPVDRWDLQRGEARRPVLVLSDHGNEIVSGLSEAYIVLKYADPDRAAAYRPLYTAMIDKLLDLGRNPHKAWVTQIDTPSGAVSNERPAHCWGYMYLGVYMAYLSTGEPRYRAALAEALDALAANPRYLFDDDPPSPLWAANAYSDSIESVLVLLNRLDHPGVAAQLDIAAEKMLQRIRDDGIVEDWHGDGNYIRTALMYALWKTRGAFLRPWTTAVRLGGVETENGSLLLHLAADADWSGRLHLDHPRHQTHFNMPLNYPRLNEWPQWYTVEHDRLYELRIDDGPPQLWLGADLVDGLQMRLKPGQIRTLRIQPATP